MTYRYQKERIKGFLKRYRSLQYINARIKSHQTKLRYERLCRVYGTPSVLTESEDVIDLGKRLWKKHHADEPEISRRPRVLWVGTDYEQDRSGLIQGLLKVAEVTVFENSQGSYGQLWPSTLLEIERYRRLNGERLKDYLNQSTLEPPYEMIIGQMWGLSMDWQALSIAQERGVRVVNISMDDRHAFPGRKLADGTHGGTLGLVPYLSLACTDAPECVKWYEKEGCRAIFFPEASDPDIFRPSKEPKIHEVSFVGAKYGIREKVVSVLKSKGIRVEAYGRGWPNGRIPTDLVPELFARSQIVLGCGTVCTCSDFYALKLRDFDVPMSGSLYLTHDNPDLRTLFDVGRDMLTFKTVADLVDKTVSVLNGHIPYNASKVREKFIEQHTWERRFRVLLSHLSKSKFNYNR